MLAVAQADIEAVRRANRESAEFFIEFLLYRELTLPIPPIHVEVFDRMKDPEVSRLLLAIPRGFSKTTLAKLYVIWAWLHTSKRFTVYLSNTSPIAKNACRDIMGFMHSHNFQAVYGRIQIEKESESEGLWIFRIPGVGNKRCILRAAGANQQMRGINIDNQRPELAIVDDLEDRENTETKLLQEKLDAWVFRVFFKALARHSKVIWIGNMISQNCLLYRLSKSPNWKSIIYGALVYDSTGKVTSLWPEHISHEALIQDFQEYRRLGMAHIWMAEMMNRPTSESSGFDTTNLMRLRVPSPAEVLHAFITIDPAFSRKEYSDNTAIVVHGIFEDRPPGVLAYRVGRLDETATFHAILEFAFRWRAWTIGIEAQAAQASLLFLYRYLAQEHGVEGLTFVPLMAGQRKAERIAAWVAALQNGSYWIPESDEQIVMQLLFYNRARRDNDDDLIDACAYGPQMLENYLGLIRSTYPSQRANVAPKYGLEICGA